MAQSEREVERLVRENQKLVHYVVNRYLKRYSVHGMEREDLVSWGMIGLLRGCARPMAFVDGPLTRRRIIRLPKLPSQRTGALTASNGSRVQFAEERERGWRTITRSPRRPQLR
jgi:hypothetical protein